MPSNPDFLGHASLADCLQVWRDEAGNTRKLFAKYRDDLHLIECRLGGFGIGLHRWYCATAQQAILHVGTNSAAWSQAWRPARVNAVLFDSLPHYTGLRGEQLDLFGFLPLLP